MNGIFLLFAGDYFYPSGGAIDFVGRFWSLEEAKEAASEHHGDYQRSRRGDWGHVAELTVDGLKVCWSWSIDDEEES